jgi:hypothetical protein
MIDQMIDAYLSFPLRPAIGGLNVPASLLCLGAIVFAFGTTKETKIRVGVIVFVSLVLMLIGRGC